MWSTASNPKHKNADEVSALENKRRTCDRTRVPSKPTAEKSRKATTAATQNRKTATHRLFTSQRFGKQRRRAFHCRYDTRRTEARTRTHASSSLSYLRRGSFFREPPPPHRSPTFHRSRFRGVQQTKHLRGWKKNKRDRDVYALRSSSSTEDGNVGEMALALAVGSGGGGRGESAARGGPPLLCGAEWTRPGVARRLVVTWIYGNFGIQLLIW